jgi:alkylhydroperoxidase/carboxymuconolactone decarboxylase family protein YurZ
MSQIKDRMRAFLGSEPPLFSAMSASPEYLEAQWAKYETVLGGDGEVSRRDKELIGLGVAIAKPSAYMIKFQKDRAKAAGADDNTINNAVRVSEFFEGADAYAHALRIDSDLRPRPLLSGDMSTLGKEDTINVPLVRESKDPEVNAVWEEIKKAMGIPFIPNFFMAMAHQPAMMRAKWNAYKATMMTPGEPSRCTRELIAVAVSAVNSCNY